MVTYYSDLDWRRRGCETGQQKKLSYLTIVSTPLESFLSSTRSLRREREKVKEYDKVQEVITIMEE